MLTDPGMQALISSNCCPPRAGSILSLVSDCLGKNVSSFFVRCSAVGAVAAGSWMYAQADLVSWEGWSECPGRVAFSSHPRKQTAGVLPLAWARIAAGFGAKIQQDLITTTSIVSNWVGFTLRRAYEQKTTQIHDGCTAVPSVPFPHRKHKGNKLSVQLSCLARATCIVWSSPVSAVPCC